MLFDVVIDIGPSLGVVVCRCGSGLVGEAFVIDMHSLSSVDTATVLWLLLLLIVCGLVHCSCFGCLSLLPSLHGKTEWLATHDIFVVALLVV